MDDELLELEIVTPERVLFSGYVEWVMLPGAKAPFTVLYNHAPLVSTLCSGIIKCKVGRDVQVIAVKSGFVEVKDNRIIACVEV